jgi:hypothetical protein
MLLLTLFILVSLSLGVIGLLILITMPPSRGSRNCLSCGYSRAGLIDGSLCPECGRPPDEPRPFQIGGLSSLCRLEAILLAAGAMFTAAAAALAVILTAAGAIVTLAAPLAAVIGALPGLFVGAATVRTRRDWLASAEERRP